MTLNLGLDWYQSLFETGKSYRYAGESSTHYTKLPVYEGAAERMHAYNPNARLIYLMRNPFDRLVSHYWHEVRKIEHGGEHRDLLSAVDVNSEYVAFSHYARQLAPYIALFGREAIYTLTFEALKKDPQGEVNKIFSWLDLPAHDISNATGEIHNRKPEATIGVAGIGILNRIRLSKPWGYASKFVPKSLKEVGNRLAEKRIDETRINMQISQLRERIEPLQHKQIDELSALLGKDFPEWSGKSNA